MDISAVSLSAQPLTSSRSTGENLTPKLNAPSSIAVTEQSIDVASQPINAPQNPTYTRPIQPNISATEPQSQKVINDEAPTINGEHPETEQDTSITNADADKANHEQHNHDEIYSEAELKLISDLKVRDAEVNAHEKAHAAVGGQHAGSPSYSYKTGPDGVKYAVSGEVSIDTSEVPGDPQATLQKAQQIKAAALAPAEPSGQDRKVAAKADQMAAQARSDLLAGNSEAGKTTSPNSYGGGNVPEHFTQQENLKVENSDKDKNTMSLRSANINALYQNSANVSNASQFDIQV